MLTRYTCGGCLLPYESTASDGLTRSTCPRCNPGKTANKPLKFCERCGESMTLNRVLTAVVIKNGRYEVWGHVITGSALCMDQLDMTPDGELVDARDRGFDAD